MTGPGPCWRKRGAGESVPGLPMVFGRGSGRRIWLVRFERAENLLKGLVQRDVHVSQPDGMAEIHQRGDAETGIGDATRNDRRKMTEIRLDIDGDAVERHPPLQSHADRGDLVLIALTLVRSLDPDTDP